MWKKLFNLLGYLLGAYVVVSVCIFIYYVSNSMINSRNNIWDIELFKGSEVWDLAKAVKVEDVEVIQQLAPNTNLNYKDTLLDVSLLYWSIYNNKYESFKKLLELGANPNILSYSNGLNEEPSGVLSEASKKTSSSVVPILENIKYTSETDASKFVKLLVQYKTLKFINCDTATPNHIMSATIIAAGYNLESLKLLIKAGGDINYECPIHFSCLYNAVVMNKIDIVNYLVIEHNIDITKPIDFDIDNKPRYINNYLRLMRFNLGTKEHQEKMVLVDYLKTQGIDYWTTPIPDRYKKIYTQEYLDKY